MCRKPWAFALAILAAILTGAWIAGCGNRFQRAEAESNPPGRQIAPSASHTISVTFDYDFKQNPPCTPKVKTKTCVKQFNVYDVSGGRYKLFSIPVPAGATSPMKGITGTSPQRQFEQGRHFIAVTAEGPSGIESDVNAAKVSVEVKPTPPDAGAAPSH